MPTPTLVDEVPVVHTLRPADRCDRCAAQAYVRVIVSSMPLDFCAHDYHRSEAGLAAAGAEVVVDNRAQLTVQPGASV